ncbi:hypothetical protein AVEN_228574-1 [Araneus ventricosus]|uniref:Uncharacterized protein n=1 Tax=Araneus ventricosus TaxID=182803 RepID=A0A4Y2FR30_ARAVE|nr:hypothetical protein AVEN_228574-1 [Araneus ventricosus]
MSRGWGHSLKLFRYENEIALRGKKGSSRVTNEERKWLKGLVPCTSRILSTHSFKSLGGDKKWHWYSSTFCCVNGTPEIPIVGKYSVFEKLTKEKELLFPRSMEKIYSMIMNL